MPFSGSCSVSAELLENAQIQNSIPSQILLEVPEAYVILSRGYAIGIDPYETTSELASYVSPEMGMVPRHTSCEHHTRVLLHFQPLKRHLSSMGKCALGALLSRCIVVSTDASKTGWGTVCNGCAASGVWMGP